MTQSKKDSSRELQKKESRTRILDSAYRLFCEKGIDSTKTADIATGANLSHGAIFVHFKTRQDIVLSVMDQFGQTLRSEIDQNMRREKDLRSMLHAFVQSVAVYEDFYVELLSVLSKMPEKVQASFLMIQTGFSFYFLPVVEHEMDSSDFVRLGEKTILNTWFALLHYYLTHRSFYRTDGPLLEEKGPEIVEEYIKLLNLRSGKGEER